GSFSKTFCMTGFRLGFAVGHEDLVGGLAKCKGQIDSGAPIFIQKAAIAALNLYNDQGYLTGTAKDNNDEFGERRKVLVEGLNDLGFNVKMPKGTFYVWFDCGKSSMDFTKEMIDKGIIVTPGTGFGGEDGYIRMAVTRNIDSIQEALRRMGKKNN
ncbi:MAG: aminotransferase class I/II-fold pyridoxal phosphate-dependent enzyme, partial [Candidatus Methanomethylophilus sp.]|nr:aminotransferase class I/II-fold pyridoxal phosphate-dependent enzyme [Methanomethylophilus sp.]